MNILDRLGHLSMMLNKKEEAAEFYDKILEFDVTNVMVYEQLMDIYQETDKYQYYVYRGNLHSIEHKFEHAINDYKKALANTQEQTNIITTRFVLAALYTQTANSRKAIDEYLRLIDYEEIPPETFLNLANLYVKEDALASAINVLERAFSKNIDTENIREKLAGLHLKNHNPEKALEITKDELMQAKCLQECGKTEEAFKILELPEAKKKDLAKYHSLLAQFYFLKNDFDKALEEVNEFEKIEKNSPLTYQMKALIYENQKDDYNAHVQWGKFNIVRGIIDIAINEFLFVYLFFDVFDVLMYFLFFLLREKRKESTQEKKNTPPFTFTKSESSSQTR